jgi:hypothetical protein
MAELIPPAVLLAHVRPDHHEIWPQNQGKYAASVLEFRIPDIE